MRKQDGGGVPSLGRDGARSGSPRPEGPPPIPVPLSGMPRPRRPRSRGARRLPEGYHQSHARGQLKGNRGETAKMLEGADTQTSRPGSAQRTGPPPRAGGQYTV